MIPYLRLSRVVAGLSLVAMPLSAEVYDLVIYGGSSAAISAAVQTKRMGGTVVIIEPSQRVGGLTTGGLGQTDIGNKHVIGGISREFYQAVRRWYQQDEAWKWQPKPQNFQGTGQSQTAENEDTMWTFEPSVALAIYQGWIKENQIEVVYGERLNRTGETKAVNRGDGFHVAAPGVVSQGVVKEGGKIKALVMESGRRFEGKMFMDATYEGDLMAGAGVSYTIGREGKAIYGETLNGVQTGHARHHNFVDGVDPYVKKGDPSSGLVAWIDPEGPGDEFSSDHRIQAYCFRMCLTDHPENRIPFVKPEGYDESWYELLFRNYEAGYQGFPWINSSMPNRKTDTNNNHGFSTDFIGQNYQWPEGSYEEREQIRAKHLQYQQGLMWSLANHPRVPAKVRQEYSKWGMSRDEFEDGQGWQQQLYVREGRRMISELVMTQDHCQGKKPVTDSVGMGAYTMDSHHVQRHVTEKGFVKNEGDVQVGGFPPYPIGFDSIVPRKAEVENLVVPIALSASHISFGSIRMEPVFMILGQSGATAAMQAIAEKKSLQDIDRKALRERLLQDKQILEYEAPKPQANFTKLEGLPGLVMDETSAKLKGPWTPSSILVGIHQGYLHDHAGEHGECSAEFEWIAPEDGVFSVQMVSHTNPNRSTKTRVEVSIDGKAQTHRINQKQAPTVDKLWLPIQDVELKTGQKVKVRLSNEGADGHVVLDAFRLLKK